MNDYKQIYELVSKNYERMSIETIKTYQYIGDNVFATRFHVTREFSVYNVEDLNDASDANEVLNAGTFDSYDVDKLSYLYFEVC